MVARKGEVQGVRGRSVRSLACICVLDEVTDNTSRSSSLDVSQLRTAAEKAEGKLHMFVNNVGAFCFILAIASSLTLLQATDSCAVITLIKCGLSFARPGTSIYEMHFTDLDSLSSPPIFPKHLAVVSFSNPPHTVRRNDFGTV